MGGEKSGERRSGYMQSAEPLSLSFLGFGEFDSFSLWWIKAGVLLRPK
jgi:hypothetical protein